MSSNRIGEPINATTALQYGLIWKIVPPNKVIEEAIETATKIAGMSPDSVIVSRAGVREGLEGGSGMSFLLLLSDLFPSLLSVLFCFWWFCGLIAGCCAFVL